MSKLQSNTFSVLGGLDRIEKLAEELRAKLKNLRAQKCVPCGACDQHHRICDLDLVRTHWYVPPRGCTDGDYWRAGEWQFICPLTNTLNRLLFSDPYEVRTVIGKGGEATFKYLYLDLFRSRTDTYKDDTPKSWVNNTYIDENRKAFDLPEKAS